MVLGLNVLLLCATAYFILSLFRVRRLLDFILGGVILSVFELVILFQIFSVFHLLGSVSFIIPELFLLLSTIALWLKQGKPAGLTSADLRKLLEVTRSFFADARNNWPLFILIAAVLIFFLAALPYLLTTYVINGDMVFYHYPKIAIWHQTGSIFFTPDSARFITDSRIVGSPPVYEMLVYYLFLSLGSFRGLGIIDCMAAFVAMLAIFCLADSLTGSRKGALASALVFMTFPILSDNILKPDATLLALSLFLSGLTFLKRYLEDNSAVNIFFSSAGLVLAFATKPTIYFLLPVTLGYLVVMLVLFYKGRELFRQFALWAAIGLVCLLVISGGILVQNTIIYRDPLLLNSWGDTDTAAQVDPARCFTVNLARYVYIRTVPIL